MQPRIQHIVETRFSMVEARSPLRASADRRFSPEWLEERLELLRRFCLPSMAAQTTENFTWALFCDEITDGDVLSSLRGHAADVPDLRLAMTGPGRGHAKALGELIDPEADVLITTRLDSDDAIADEYLEAVQAYAEPFSRSTHRDLLVNMPQGYRLDTSSGGLFADCMECSSFHSLLERPRDCEVRTVMHGGHPQLHYDHMTQQDESLVGWLIVVHDNNLINKIRDGLPRVELDGAEVPGFSLAGDALAVRTGAATPGRPGELR